jgi:dsRNA-specific ribonuclease
MSGEEMVPPSAVPIPDPKILFTDAALAVIEKTLGYEFRNKENLKLALTHISTNPSKVPSEDSDRLETLGDKLLGN